MLDNSSWPFYPYSLRQIIDPETLAVIETGSCERAKRALTILDRTSLQGDKFERIETIGEKRWYEPFCERLRRTPEGDKVCRCWDIQQAQKSLKEFRLTGDPYRCFSCHMGLTDISYVIQVHNRPVAVILTGQYCPIEGNVDIVNAIRDLGNSDEPVIPVQNEEEKATLIALAGKLQRLPEDAEKKFAKEAEYVMQYAEAEFRLQKSEKEQKFLDRLHSDTVGPPSINREALEKRLKELLSEVQEFLHCQYSVFFGSIMEDDTVLSPIEYCAIPENISHSLPHFNWRKAGLPVENFNFDLFDPTAYLTDGRSRGIRGENCEFFNNAALIIPFSLGDRYRGIFLTGPFAEEVDLHFETRFLKELASIIGLFTLTSLEVIYLERERQRWQTTANLLSHQVKTALTPITTYLGWARSELHKPNAKQNLQQIDKFLRHSEDLSIHLAESVGELLKASVLLIQKEDLHCENSQLSALVSNCASGFINRARQEWKELVIDPSIEMLPEAYVDVARLTIALENLIENAIKYSYPETRIDVRSQIDFSGGVTHMAALLKVSNLGAQVRQDELETIFQMGVRGANASTVAGKKVAGSGLGLWEARSIVQAHNGKISASCEPTAYYRRDTRLYTTTFTIALPIEDNKPEERRS